ncbi:hypothetical protein GLAREA_07668 [Glarea lozoyensis ATCC 20868]|uniref:Uncharacterized protein n=1 Tax=Glarea lozoyensis (strain ATCC 20868 / MF5171) TaxID=1116229 RepID=S3D5X4_GLAL2|nr:uncharacterized protein GLAREA_07668 [Glarea lozoyensis ATCC 20868]EPE32534.1 hypothetical protein GLAREA_07668 [Glarea lozoyensis ATCC 20868]
MPASTRATRSTANSATSRPRTPDEQSLQSPTIMPPSKKTKLKDSGTQTKRSKPNAIPSTERRTKKPKNEAHDAKSKPKSSVSQDTSDKVMVLKRPGKQPSSSSGLYGGDEDSGESQDDSQLSLPESTKNKEKAAEFISPKLFKRAKAVSWDSAASNMTGKTGPVTETIVQAGRKRKRNVLKDVSLKKKKQGAETKRNRWGETLSEEEEREKEEDGDELSPSLNPSPTTLEMLIRGVKRKVNKAFVRSPKSTIGPRRSIDGEKDFSLYGFPPTPGVSRSIEVASWPPITLSAEEVKVLFEQLCQDCHFVKASLTWIPWGSVDSEKRTISWTYPLSDDDKISSHPNPPVQEAGKRRGSSSTPESLGFGSLYRDFYETIDALDLHLTFTLTKNGEPYVVSEIGLNPLERRVGPRGETVVSWRERYKHDWDMDDDGNYHARERDNKSFAIIAESKYVPLGSRDGVASELFSSGSKHKDARMSSLSPGKGRDKRRVSNDLSLSEAQEYDSEESFHASKTRRRQSLSSNPMSPRARLPSKPAKQQLNSPSVLAQKDGTEQDSDDDERAADPELYRRLQERLKELSVGAPMICWTPRLFMKEDGTRRSLKERLELQIIYREAEAKDREEEAMKTRTIRTRNLSFDEQEDTSFGDPSKGWFKEIVATPMSISHEEAEKRLNYLAGMGSPIWAKPAARRNSWVRKYEIFDPASRPHGICNCPPKKASIFPVWSKLQVSGKDPKSPMRSGAILELRGQCRTCGKLISKTDSRGIGEKNAPTGEPGQDMVEHDEAIVATNGRHHVHFANQGVEEDDRWILGAPPPLKNGVKAGSSKNRKRNPAAKKKSKKRAAVTNKKAISTDSQSKIAPKTQEAKKRKKPAKKVV